MPLSSRTHPDRDRNRGRGDGGRRPDTDRYKLFVGSLAWTTTEDTLQSLFGQFGELLECRLCVERDDPSRSRGFAFVSFAEEGPMAKAVEALDGGELDGRQIKVNRAQPRERGGGPGEGDWPCPQCRANCFASRTECFRCGTPRPQAADGDAERDGGGYKGRGGGGGNLGEHGYGGGAFGSLPTAAGRGRGRAGGRGGDDGGGGAKYKAAHKRNMETTVAEDQEEDGAQTPSAWSGQIG